MKKIIALITIGTSAAFWPAQAQEAPQTQRTQEEVTRPAQEAPAAEEKVQIEASELPQPVMDSFENGEYANMSIVSAYEVNRSNSRTSTSFEEAAARQTNETTNYAEQTTDDATTSDGIIENTPHTVADTAINEVNAGDPVADETEQAESAITETPTTEDREDTGEVVSAATPEVDDTTTEPTVAADIEDKGKELYENNQYDNYTDANENAYEKIAEEEVDTSGENDKQYELQVEGDEGSATLIYREDGELVKAEKGSM